MCQRGGELLAELDAGKVELSKVKKDELPVVLQKLSGEELKNYVAKQQETRTNLLAQIAALDKKRQDYIDTEKKRRATEGKTDSFDAKVAEMINTQAARKGIN